MTFVYEHISDEDKKRIDFSKITVLGHEADPYRWVIDRELNAFLIWVIEDRDPPHDTWYAFYLQGKVFPTTIFQQQSIQISNGQRIIPVQYRILLPEGMLPGTPEYKNVLDKIEEAIAAFIRGAALDAGWGHKVSKVQVKYVDR